MAIEFWRRMGGLIQDVRLAMRTFGKAPVFTMGAILTLMLAIGANTAIFSILNALVLRDLPVREPSSLISITRVTPATADAAFSLPMFRAIAERQQSLSALIGWTSNTVINIETDDVRTRGNVSAVTGNYFTELGIRPVIGRVLTDADVSADTPHSAPIAVIGHAFWQRHFNRDPAAVGRTLRVEGTPFTIVGVAPAGFRGMGLTLEIDVAVPLTFVPIVRDVPSRAFLNGTVNPISLTGRLRPGVTIAQARAELATLWPAVLTAMIPPDYVGAQRERFLETTIQVREGAKGVEPGLRRRFTQPLMIVMAIALFVVLIACVNIASLMMSRASSRMHEMGVRIALGASRWRLVRQVLVEGVMLSLIGALLGVLVAVWGSESLVALILATSTVPPSFDVHPDLQVMAFTISLATLVGLLFSVAPAWRLGRASAVAALQGSPRTATRSGRTGRTLVAVQVGLSLVLLINAGLLVRSLQEIRAVDSGMRTDDVFVVYPAARPGGYQGVDHDSYYPAVLQRLAAIAGVRDVGISLFKPAAGAGPPPEQVSRAAAGPGSSSEVPAVQAPVSPGFFNTLGLPVLTGRDFDWGDHSRSRRVAVISQSLADRLFGGGAAVGQRIRFGITPENQDVEVVGIVADARLHNLKDRNVAAAYVPALQTPDPAGKCFVVRGQGVSMAAVRQAVESLGVELINSPVESLNFIVDRALLQERVVAAFAAFFGALALLMAGIGLYGLTSYHVSERRREIGIRMALGADAGRVMGRVVADAVQITAAGVLIGGAVALATVQLLRTLLFGVTTYDAVTMITAPALLLTTAIAACLGPAARAARVDPMLTLRTE
jgi:putative ABC transport system permease protein